MRHLAVCWLAWLALGAGCQREAPPASQRIAPNPRAPAAYGPPTGRAASEIARARPPASVMTASSGWSGGPGAERVQPLTNWVEFQKASLAVLQTELSPAILIHSSGPRLDLFAGATNAGLAGPSYVAWSTVEGPRTFKRDDPLDVTRMEECWVLVWWAQAQGWTDWDSPWVVYLQHKPNAMRLDGDGLHFEFPGAAGDVVLFPLYGYEKLPQPGHEFLAQHGLTGRKIQTWDWPKVLKRDPLTRIRYWAAATRELPIYAEESISVDAANDAVTIRARFRWHSIQDEWKTPHLKLAPLPPPLGLAAKLGEFPVRFSKSWFDLDVFTPYGPYLAMEGVDQWEATFAVLQYIHEAEIGAGKAESGKRKAESDNRNLAIGNRKSEIGNRKLNGAALEKLQQAAGAVFSASNAAALYACARALPYYDEVTRTNAIARLGQFLRASAPAHDRSILPTWWAYAHFSGDWQLVRERWPAIRTAFTVAKGTRWVGVGCDGVSALGDAAASCIAFARLAYQAGDMDSYHYACAQFARELVLLFVKQRGADYFRRHQPWHSLEFMDEEVFLTQLSGQAGQPAGWQFDSPRYPAQSDPKLYRERWARFQDVDLARFYREYLFEDVRRELNWLQHRSELQAGPALLLRSLLLRENPATLAQSMTNVFDGSPTDAMASSLALLLAAHDTQIERLIPPAAPSPFVAGLEREVTGTNSYLITDVRPGANGGPHGAEAANVTAGPGWPELTWPGWRTPLGKSWTFGAVRTGPKVAALRTSKLQLNWTSRVTFYEPVSASGKTPEQ